MKAEEINNNSNAINNTYNSTYQSVQSIESKSDVLQKLSELKQNVRNGATDVSQCLIVCDKFLSELMEIVAVCQSIKQADQLQSHDEMLWDASYDMTAVYSDVCSISSSLSSSDVSSDSNTSVLDSEEEERHLEQEIFVDSMVEAITQAAPDDVFNPRKSYRRRKRRKMMMVPKMLRKLWMNYREFQSPVPGTNSVSALPKPVIDWAHVNKRAVDNLPKPELFPVLGCSEDPMFYQETEEDRNGMLAKVPPKFNRSFPFGYCFGYMTQLGKCCRHSPRTSEWLHL